MAHYTEKRIFVLRSSVGFALLACDAFEIAHVCRAKRGTVDDQMVNTCRFAASLVVLHEDHQVLNVLKFDEAKLNRVSIQVFGFQTIIRGKTLL